MEYPDSTPTTGASLAVLGMSGGGVLLGGLLFRFGLSVSSDAEVMVPTGGELTLFEAVGWARLDFLLLCRSSPVGDVWRDLIDAWHRLEQAVSASRPSLSDQQQGQGP
jgi:hypothetical protein